MNESKRLTEGAMFTAIYLALLLVSFIPVVWLFVVILLPIPFVIYTNRHGIKSGVLMLIATSIIATIFFTILALPVTLMMGAGGLLIGHAIYKKRSAYETFGHGILGFIAGILFTIAFIQVLFGVNFTQEMELVATEQMQSYISFMEGFGFDNQDVDLEAFFSEQIQLYIKLTPAFIALAAVFLAFLVQWISYKVINRLEKLEYRFPPFRNLKLPASIIWLYLIVIITSFFSLDPNGIMFVAIQNAMLILETLLVIQGFSFIFFFAHYKKWSKAVPIIGIVLTVLFPIFLLYFVRILGIIDIGLNLRERLRKK